MKFANRIFSRRAKCLCWTYRPGLLSCAPLEEILQAWVATLAKYIPEDAHPDEVAVVYLSVAVSAAELRDAQLAGRLPAAAAAHLLLASLGRWHWLEVAVQIGVRGESAQVLLVVLDNGFQHALAAQWRLRGAQQPTQHLRIHGLD